MISTLTKKKYTFYFQTKNKKLKSDKLVTKKFCKFCRKHVDHKESKA